MTTNRTAALTIALLLTTSPALSGIGNKPTAPNAPFVATVTTAPTRTALPAPDQPEPPPAPQTLTPYQQTMQTWALDRLHQAHLQLPPVDIHYHSDLEPCDGYPGYFAGTENGWSIGICTPAPFVLLHELGHAWAAHNLTHTDEEAFRQTRGLPAWIDPTIPWNQRASEHVADLIAWGLSTRHNNPPTFANETYDQLARAFQALTGVTPLVEPLAPVNPAQ